MKKVFIATVSAALIGISALASDYELDNSHSSVSFSIKHLMISNVKGKFKNFDGNFSIDDKSGKITKLEGVVDVASIDTDIQKRDDHLRSADFFDAQKYPKMSFLMSKFTTTKGGKGKLAGNLMIKGVTKPVVFDAEVSKAVEDMSGNKKIALSLNTKINRKDFGLNWNKAMEAGGFVVGDEVSINIELEGTAK